MIIDSHVHIGAPGSELTAESLVERMDRAGVDRSVVFPFWGAKPDNETVAEAVRKYPARLIGVCCVNSFAKDAVKELESYMALGFRGLKLHPFLQGVNLSSHLNDPLFEIVQQHGGFVIAHGTADLYNCPLEFARMAGRFPKVPLIMAHSGYFWEWEQAVELSLEHENLFLETSRVPEYETGIILKRAGSRKVIWGTDSPYCDLQGELSKIRKCLTEEESREVLGENFACMECRIR